MKTEYKTINAKDDNYQIEKKFFDCDFNKSTLSLESIPDDKLLVAVSYGDLGLGNKAKRGEKLC